ncbi:glycosyltransferase family 2 protein [Corallibacter sp.]|uniref:glycosyltransferase family 2 protein n=1 Tax=Corallibacter sp. TaxID=2038084 RepID=UPI003AB1E4C7
MISILIPTYNYNVLPLAKNLVNRAKKQGLIFELICMDDGSNSVENKSNNNINSLPNSKFIERKTNLGRTATRQALAKEAKYDWLLFLDADITPKNDAFISQYTAFVSEPYDAIFGGFAYNPEDYKPNKSLRYTFGKNREEVDAHKRNNNKYKFIISSNFMIKKHVFFKINALNLKPAYGMDYVFGHQLSINKVPILHINNEVYHLGIDDNINYLKKTSQALHTLSDLHKSNNINDSHISLIKAYSFLKKANMLKVFRVLTKPFINQMKKYLLKNKAPNLFIFDLYRLSYFCNITT